MEKTTIKHEDYGEMDLFITDHHSDLEIIEYEIHKKLESGMIEALRICILKSKDKTEKMLKEFNNKSNEQKINFYDLASKLNKINNIDFFEETAPTVETVETWETWVDENDDENRDLFVYEIKEAFINLDVDYLEQNNEDQQAFYTFCIRKPKNSRY